MLWCLEGDRCAIGLGKPVNAEFAAREYWRAANAAYPPAMSRLAACYEEGRGVARKSLGDALLWYRKAASLQDPDALDAMGRIYEAGTWPGVPADLALAAGHFQQAAKQGHAGALAHLGQLLERGAGVVADTPQAVECYRQAAAQGHAAAMNALGSLYYAGRGVAQDARQAVHWYRTAACNGHAASMNNLALCYEVGGPHDDSLGAS